MQTAGQNLNMIWSPNGEYIAVGNRMDNLMVLDVTASKQFKKVTFGYEINEMAWGYNSDHILVATGGNDMGTIDVIGFKGDTLSLVDTICAHTSNCYSLKIDPTFNKLAVGSVDHTLSIWNLDDLISYANVQFE